MQVHDRKSLDMYAFVDPSRYKFNAEFETYIISRLNDGVLHFMPFNQKYVKCSIYMLNFFY